MLVGGTAAEADLSGAGGTEDDHLAGVTGFAFGATLAERGPGGGLGGSEIADHDLVDKGAAARAGQLAGEDVVDRPLPVDLHFGQ